MFECKIITYLASIYLFLFGCLGFEIQRDPVKTEYMVAEFLQMRNKSSFFKASWMPLPTRGFICGHSRRFRAYLCSVILQQDPYREMIDSSKYQWTTCYKKNVSSKVGIIGQKESDKIRLYNCPVADRKGPRYYFSRTHIESSLFIYVTNDRAFHIYPDAFVSDIDMSAMKKNYRKIEALRKTRETVLKQYKPIQPPPQSAEANLQSLLNQRMILIFSQSVLRKAALFQYLNFRNQKWTYQKFRMHYNKINVCSLRLQQQIYLCKQVLDNSYFGFDIDLTYYRKNDCKKRTVRRTSWRIADPISTLMCPPTFAQKKSGPERTYNWQSYFLSAGPDKSSILIFKRSFNQHYIKPTRVVSSFHAEKLAEVLRIERSQPWTDLTSSKRDAGLQFSPSPASSSDKRLITSSLFSSPSPDLTSQTTSSRPSQSSFYGLSTPDRRPSSTPPPGTTSSLIESLLFPLYGTPARNEQPVFRTVRVNHDRYVAEDETVKLSQFRSIKHPYERFQLAHATNICNFKAEARVQLCKAILEGPEFGYQLVTANTDNTSCQLRSIAVTLMDSEDLFGDKFALLRCPHVEAYDSAYYLSSSEQEGSVILFRRLGLLELTYPLAYISYVNTEMVVQKISPISSSRDFVYSSIRT